MATAVEEFFDVELQNDARPQDLISPIKSYVLNQSTAHEAVAKLVESLRAGSTTNTQAQYDISELALVLIETAEELPDTHEALVKLVVTLKQRSEVSQLGFTIELTERWHSFSDPDPNNSLRAEIRDAFKNLNHFVALVYNEGLDEVDVYGLQSLAWALKRDGWIADHGSAGANPSSSLQALDGYIPAAVQWMLVAGEKLHSQSQEARENWSAWRDCLKWIAEQSEVYESTRVIAQQAITKMQQIA